MGTESYCPSKEELPEAWELTTISEIALVNPPGGTLQAEDDELVSFVPMPAVQEITGNIDASDTRRFGDVKKGYTRFLEGDVLFAKITPCMENGKVATATGLMNGKGCGSTEFHVVRPHLGIYPDFLRLFLVQNAYRSEAKRHMSGAVGQLRVPPDYLRGSSIPLPSENEQARILSKIEELFSGLDKGEEALRRVQKLIERYRQSVLKAAVTGELTREWREQNKDKLESGEQLLKRILKARRKAWEEAELAKMHAKGQEPRDDKWKRKYKEPVGPDTSGLPELPEGWVWASVGQLLAEPLRTGLSIKGQNNPPGIPSLKLNAISGSEIDFTQVKYLPLNENDVEQHKILNNDYYISRGNGSIKLLGRGAIATNPERFTIYPDIMIRIRCAKEFARSKFMFSIWDSEFIRNQIESSAKTTAGIYKISQSQVEVLAIPMPPLDEQFVITDRINAINNDIRLLDEFLAECSSTSIHLRQSILKVAFSGQLVPQDPNDEPASELLKRIAGEKAKAESATRTSKKTKQPSGRGRRPRSGKGKARPTKPAVPTAHHDDSAPMTGKELAAARKAAGMTQAALAKATGINQAYISQMENGKRTITSGHCKIILNVLKRPAHPNKSN